MSVFFQDFKNGLWSDSSGGVGLVTGVRVNSCFWFISNYCDQFKKSTQSMYNKAINQLTRSPPKTCFLRKHSDSSVWVSRTSANGTRFRNFFNWKNELLGSKVSILSTLLVWGSLCYTIAFLLLDLNHVQWECQRHYQGIQWIYRRKNGNYCMIQRKMKNSDLKRNSLFLLANLPTKCVPRNTARGRLLRAWEEKRNPWCSWCFKKTETFVRAY